MAKFHVDNANSKHKDSNNQRIATLEEKVEQQAREIYCLQQQLKSLSLLFSNAALCLTEEVPVEPASVSNRNGSVSDKSEHDCTTRSEPDEENTAKKDAAILVQYNYKNLLQEHCAKQGWQFPTYETTKTVGPTGGPTGGYHSLITVNGETHTSKTMKSKVLAQKSAACIVLQSYNVIDEHGQPVATGDPKRNTGVSKYSWCKNQLQEYFDKRGFPHPTYNMVTHGGKGFAAEVSHDKFSEKVVGEVGGSKRIAEQMAAHKAISVWKILDTGE